MPRVMLLSQESGSLLLQIPLFLADVALGDMVLMVDLAVKG